MTRQATTLRAFLANAADVGVGTDSAGARVLGAMETGLLLHRTSSNMHTNNPSSHVHDAGETTSSIQRNRGYLQVMLLSKVHETDKNASSGQPAGISESLGATALGMSLGVGLGIDEGTSLRGDPLVVFNELDGVLGMESVELHLSKQINVSSR